MAFATTTTTMSSSPKGTKPVSSCGLIHATIDKLSPSADSGASFEFWYLYSRINENAAPRGIEGDDDKMHIIFQNIDTTAFSLMQNTWNAIQLAARLVDAPPNELHTEAFVDEAKDVAARLQTPITIIQGKELEEQGFGGIYGVEKASQAP